MNKEELSELIKTGEGITLEFKENTSNKLGKEICSFVNPRGGKILLGVSDSGKITGIKITNILKSQLQDYARNIDPSIVVDIEEIEDVLIIHIPEGNKKPYSVNGQFFLRIGANCQQLNREEIRDFFQKENLILFDNQPNRNFDFKEDFDKEKFKSFLDLAKITENLNEKDMLKNLFLFDGAYLKNAGVLFFCRDVKKYFISATITCVLYQGKNKTIILDKKDFNSDILSNYENALSYTFSKLNTQYIIKKDRIERLELPEEALRETIINSIVHRDYFSTGHVQIDIYLDRIEITNPGGLVKGLSKKDLGKISLPRNPLIMDLMLRVHKVEKIGSGIGRILNSMKSYGLSVKFNSSSFFNVVLQRPFLQKSNQESNQESDQKSDQKIIELISQYPEITIEELMLKLNYSESGIKKIIKKLKESGWIIRVGPKKGGHWKVIR